MNRELVFAIARHCKERIAAGDCPPPQAFSVGQLEEAIVELTEQVIGALTALADEAPHDA